MATVIPIEVKPGKSTSEALGSVLAAVISALAIPAVAWIKTQIGVDLDPVLFTTLVVAIIASVTGISMKYTGDRTSVKTATANAAADVQVAALQKEVAQLELMAVKAQVAADAKALKVVAKPKARTKA